MKEFFSIEGPFMQFFGKLWDIILLSVVFCVCSIPIITFGMNCIALYYTVVKVVLPGERHAVRTFLKMVPRNARQGLPLGILFEIIIAVLTYSLIVILHNDMGALGVFFGVVFVMLFMIVLVVMAYAFPMSARFENTLGEIVEQCFYGIGTLERDNIFADPAGGISCGNDIDCVYSTDHTDLAGSNYVDAGKIVGAGV